MAVASLGRLEANKVRLGGSGKSVIILLSFIHILFAYHFNELLCIVSVCLFIPFLK